MCDKRVYETRQLANDAIAGFNNDVRPTRSNKKPTKAYYCEHCEGYHLYTEGKKNGSRKDHVSKEFHFTTDQNKERNKGHQTLRIRNYNI